MSDERSELSAALHEFAEGHETPPVLSGAEVRGHAVRRARRRRAGTLAAGTAALALVAFALTLDFAGEGNHRQVPAATPAVPSPPPATSGEATPGEATPAVPTSGTVDLDRRTLTVGDRVMTMTSGVADSPKLVGPLTVYRKLDGKILSVTNPTDGIRYNADVAPVVELRDADNQPFYVGAALSYEAKNMGKDDTTSGWISLDVADAKWFHTSVKTGSVLSVTGPASAVQPAVTPPLTPASPARPSLARPKRTSSKGS